MKIIICYNNEANTFMHTKWQSNVAHATHTPAGARARSHTHSRIQILNIENTIENVHSLLTLNTISVSCWEQKHK